MYTMSNIITWIINFYLGVLASLRNVVILKEKDCAADSQIQIEKSESNRHAC